MSYNLSVENLVSSVKFSSEEEKKDCSKYLSEFLRAVLDKDRPGIEKYSNLIFPFSKKYLGQLNQEISKKIKCNVLISTVGMQKQPVILMILLLKPKLVYLLHTLLSENTAIEVQKDEIISDYNIKTELKLISETNAADNYRIIDSIVNWIRGQGEYKHFCVDPTAGRKAMSVSAGIYASYKRIRMVYLKAEESMGIAVPFTERLTFIENPFEIIKDDKISIIKMLFNQGHYSEAYNVINEITSDLILDENLNNLIHNFLKPLIESYMQWDKFNHSDVNILNKLKHISQKDCSSLGIDKNVLENNIEFLDKMHKKGEYSEYKLIDIYRNALRKGKQGNYDDAVARLYRCTEYSASLILLSDRLNIRNTKNPNYEKIIQIFQANDFKEFKVIVNNMLKDNSYNIPHRWKSFFINKNESISLDMQMFLIYVLGLNFPELRNISLTYLENFIDSNLLSSRNSSILAHGNIPVISKQYNDFRENTERLIKSVISYLNSNNLIEENFDSLIKISEHLQFNSF